MFIPSRRRNDEGERAMKPHKHAECIKAWADGKTIQAKANGSDWVDWSMPDWYDITGVGYQYRIKPEPKPDVVKYIKEVSYENYWIEYLPTNNFRKNTIKLTFDGKTGELKSAEVLK